MSKAEIEALKGEIEAKRKAKADGELENAGCAPTGKLLIKNRRVLKGHFAKIYAMHWAESPQCKNNLVSASQDGQGRSAAVWRGRLGAVPAAAPLSTARFSSMRIAS